MSSPTNDTATKALNAARNGTLRLRSCVTSAMVGTHPGYGKATNTRTTNALIRAIRAIGRRADAELKERRRARNHVTLGPSRISDIARAALVPTQLGNDHR